jgi:hypothetical protein
MFSQNKTNKRPVLNAFKYAITVDDFSNQGDDRVQMDNKQSASPGRPDSLGKRVGGAIESLSRSRIAPGH